MPSATPPALLLRSKGLSRTEREELLQPYLPQPRLSADTTSHSPAGTTKRPPPRRQSLTARSTQTLQTLASTTIHRILYLLIQALVTIYIRLRQTYHALYDRIISILYYHHRTPELIARDVRGLSRLPRHLSVILSLDPSTSRGHEAEALAKLVADVAEIATWCVCAGIPLLSVYERSGALKQHMPSLHRTCTKTLRAYFPPDALPSLHIRAPHHAAYSPPAGPRRGETASLQLLLLSATDGRRTLVDLTKTLAEMSQRGALRPEDVSSELIDAEIVESSCGEPDLLVVMASGPQKGRARRKSRSRASSAAGERSGEESDGGRGTLAAPLGDGVSLRGYPPWQVRLTEIAYDQDGAGVGYQVFLRALHRYAKAEMRFGR